MPTQYFAFIDGEQKGPFTADRLIDMGVRPSTYVWSKEMDDWHRADEVEEIRNLFRRHIERKSEQAAERVAQPAGQQQQPPRPAQSPHEDAGFPMRKGRLGMYFPETEEKEDLDRPPQVSMVLAFLSMFLCFLPTGIAAVIFAYKAQKSWEQAVRPGSPISPEEGVNLRRKAHEYERMGKMWLGLTVAFGIIFWTLVFSIR